MLGGVVRGVLLVWVVALVAWPSHHPPRITMKMGGVVVSPNLIYVPAEFDWRWDVCEVRGDSMIEWRGRR